ncbi:MAG: hypothetical protein JJU28_16415 [Cyclobacteriaceae bacterium]|nr:hypothetical protein [Cyclobacteriaceae bacterium]
MKIFSILLLTFIILFACETQSRFDADEIYTGNAVVYPLFAGTEFPFDGKVTIRERTDEFTEIDIQVKNTQGPRYFPIHLHYSSFDVSADLAAWLEPLSAATGNSKTLIKYLANESPVTYHDLIEFDGHIKIHLESGPMRDVILSYGNIGLNANKPIDREVALCTEFVPAYRQNQ